MNKERILIVDDEPSIVQLARMYLEREGFRVESASDGEQALSKIRQLSPDLVILDIMLPKLDGFEICKILRADKNPVLILMLTARDDDIDKIIGLEIGADDYMTKPFNPREMVARVKALLRRRSENRYMESKQILLGNVKILPDAREVYINGKRIVLRNQEFDLLMTLVQHKGMVLSREQLLQLAWGYEFAGQTRTVDVHIGQLRKKFKDADIKIETVTGVGYKLIIL